VNLDNNFLVFSTLFFLKKWSMFLMLSSPLIFFSNDIANDIVPKLSIREKTRCRLSTYNVVKSFYNNDNWYYNLFLTSCFQIYF